MRHSLIQVDDYGHSESGAKVSKWDEMSSNIFS